MKKISLIVGFIFTFFTWSFSQEVREVDNEILIDGVKVFKVKYTKLIDFSIFSLDDEELIYCMYNENETPSYYDDDYIVINFLTKKLKVETTKRDKIAVTTGVYKKSLIKLINLLITEKVMNVDGTLNEEKLNIFYEKHHENITERTIR